MKRTRFLIATLLFSSAWMSAQTSIQQPPPQPSLTDDDAWNHLSWLTPETEVSISGPHHFPVRCINLQVTDEGVSCESHSFWIPTRYFELSRSEVRGVSLRHDRRNLWIGVAALSTAGFAIGASGSSPGPYQYRTENGLIGAGLGGLVSFPLVMAVVPFLPGHNVYRPGSSAAFPKKLNLPARTHAFLARLRPAHLPDSPLP